MKIVTSKGKTYPVAWIDTPINDDTRLWIHLVDDRRLPVIAGEFDGLTRIERRDEDQGDKVFDGYGILRHISRDVSGVMLILSKG